MFLDVLFDSESSKETESKELSLSISSHDESSTRDVPDIPLDSGSSKESQIKDLCPSEDILEEANNSNIVEKDINTTRVDPEVASERKSKRMKNRKRIRKKRTDYRIILSSKMLLFSAQCWNPSS